MGPSCWMSATKVGCPPVSRSLPLGARCWHGAWGGLTPRLGAASPRLLMPRPAAYPTPHPPPRSQEPRPRQGEAEHPGVHLRAGAAGDAAPHALRLLLRHRRVGWGAAAAAVCSSGMGALCALRSRPGLALCARARTHTHTHRALCPSLPETRRGGQPGLHAAAGSVGPWRRLPLLPGQPPVSGTGPRQGGWHAQRPCPRCRAERAVHACLPRTEACQRPRRSPPRAGLSGQHEAAGHHLPGAAFHGAQGGRPVRQPRPVLQVRRGAAGSRPAGSARGRSERCPSERSASRRPPCSPCLAAVEPCREAEFIELECRLSSQQVEAYDAAARLWQDLRHALVQAVAGEGRVLIGLTTGRHAEGPGWMRRGTLEASQRHLAPALRLFRPRPHCSHVQRQGCVEAVLGGAAALLQAAL